MRISVVGTGYVGLSIATLLSEYHQVISLDISKQRVDSINKKISPIRDHDIDRYFNEKKLNLSATINKVEAYTGSEFIVIATPTNYDHDTGNFDTSTVEQVLSEILSINKETTIIIKSTVPLGFTIKMRKYFKYNNIFFSPEFLRESRALYDNLYPSRIVIGDFSENSKKFANTLIKCSNKNSESVQVIYMSPSEAEAVKLFSNTFLAMRISFFNELDSFSEIHELDSKKIIEGVCSDSRIGNYYNNPSFGYGGYCLPKDTKQLLGNFNDVPNNIIKAVVESNKTRKIFIANTILSKKPKTIGIYRLIMKNGSDNFRESAIIDIIDEIKKIESKIKIFIYEPFLRGYKFKDNYVISDLQKFISDSDIIIANRISEELKDVKDKVYSRDIFNEN